MTVVNSTLSGNSGAAGIYNIGTSLRIGNTILKTGSSGGNIFNVNGSFTSLGYNLSGDDGSGLLTGTGDQINTDPLLGPLANNGGPTPTQHRFRTARRSTGARITLEALPPDRISAEASGLSFTTLPSPRRRMGTGATRSGRTLSESDPDERGLA